jgi:hypothetical protein
VNRFAAALVCLLGLAGCERPVESAKPVTQRAEEDTLENDNRLNLAFGAAVVERSDELSYESTAAHAIDATARTAWISAPGGKQTAIYSLPAPTRITRLGASIVGNRNHAPGGVRFETSVDGRTWNPAVEARFQYGSRAPQWFDVKPIVAQYVRVTAIEPAFQSHFLSLLAIGTETAPVAQPSIEGCWQINMVVPARFVRAGSRVAGTIGPMIVDGGTDGRIYRLMWRERAMWGYAAVTLSPDGQHLSGIRWHEEVNPKNTGDGWLGNRVPCEDTVGIDTAGVADGIMGRAGVWRLYGVRFDSQDRIATEESANALNLTARIIREHPSRHFRVVAREFRESTEEKNRARCTAKLDAVRDALRSRGTDLKRLEFVVAGSERGPLSVDFTTLHVMDSGVELQVVAAR